jgi:hypothetical protein
MKVAGANSWACRFPGFFCFCILHWRTLGVRQQIWSFVSFVHGLLDSGASEAFDTRVGESHEPTWGLIACVEAGDRAQASIAHWYSFSVVFRLCDQWFVIDRLTASLQREMYLRLILSNVTLSENASHLVS